MKKYFNFDNIFINPKFLSKEKFSSVNMINFIDNFLNIGEKFQENFLEIINNNIVVKITRQDKFSKFNINTYTNPVNGYFDFNEFRFRYYFSEQNLNFKVLDEQQKIEYYVNNFTIEYESLPQGNNKFVRKISFFLQIKASSLIDLKNRKFFFNFNDLSCIKFHRKIEFVYPSPKLRFYDGIFLLNDKENMPNKENFYLFYQPDLWFFDKENENTILLEIEKPDQLTKKKYFNIETMLSFIPDFFDSNIIDPNISDKNILNVIPFLI